jgi:hypothetical protein
METTTKANIDIKITGIRGGSANYSENKGKVEVFVDSGYFNTEFIVADAFSGAGNTYKRREKTLIQIQDRYGRMWAGTFEDLAAKIFDNS